MSVITLSLLQGIQEVALEQRRLGASQTDMWLVASATNGREAIEQFRLHRPDVTLMDLQMPEMNGLDALIAIRSESPEARIILLTAFVGDVFKRQRRKGPPNSLAMPPMML